jgi:arginyl-tRNA synthetase
MPAVPSLAALLDERFRRAMADAGGDAGDVDPRLMRSDRADWQVNGLLALAKARGENPRELAGRVVAAIPADGVVEACEVSGPGFVNVTVADAAITSQVARRLEDARLGVAAFRAGHTTVIDYSQPNIAKEMHVGHLRSIVIGDALARVLDFGGDRVVRQNHIGDWGTQFGMLIQDLRERPDQHAAPTEDGNAAMSWLDHLYRDARARFDGDAGFAERARGRVVALQAGDPDTLAAWGEIVDRSRQYFAAVYDRLGVLLVDDDAVGESFYNPDLPAVCTELERLGVAVRDRGALCVFFDDVTGPDGEPVPLIVQKRDGGFNYATTDLAAIRHRVGALGADRILYVVDARQALHLRMVFETARRAGWLPDRVDARHLPFGTVLGPDGRPFKTRAGDTVRLVDLLDQAVEQAAAVVADKNPDLAGDELAERARQVGIGAVKYADLSTSRTRDYRFDVDRMISLTGDTGVYLQYAHARVRSLLRRAGDDATPGAHPDLALEPAERSLGLHLDAFGDTLAEVADSCEPHRLAGYLHELATGFTTFYEQCPVLAAGTPAAVENRLLYCHATAATLRCGMGLLGIEAPDRL